MNSGFESNTKHILFNILQMYFAYTEILFAIVLFLLILSAERAQNISLENPNQPNSAPRCLLRAKPIGTHIPTVRVSSSRFLHPKLRRALPPVGVASMFLVEVASSNMSISWSG